MHLRPRPESQHVAFCNTFSTRRARQSAQAPEDTLDHWHCHLTRQHHISKTPLLRGSLPYPVLPCPHQPPQHATAAPGPAAPRIARTATLYPPSWRRRATTCTRGAARGRGGSARASIGWRGGHASAGGAPPLPHIHSPVYPLSPRRRRRAPHAAAVRATFTERSSVARGPSGASWAGATAGASTSASTSCGRRDRTEVGDMPAARSRLQYSCS
jgi:hypothetical protein